MRRSNTQSIGDVLREFIKESRIERKLKEVDAIHSWEGLLGKTVARYTRNIYIHKKVMYVEISSSVVKNELVMMRHEIVRKLNEQAGEEIIDRIVFK